MTAYYNEFNPEAAAWLRELIKEKLIAPGEVDERSIIDVEAKELKGYRQHHFFAGIGGWSYALRLAGWPDDHPVWTASLPCQPFSTAGKQLGKQDERHLLPYFLELVKKCKPDVIFGEQVERAIAHGWLDDLQTNMEAEGYAVGHCVLGAHSVGAAHIRQRLYWVADSDSKGLQRRGGTERCLERQNRQAESLLLCNGGVADTEITSRERPESRSDRESYSGELDWIYCRDNKYRPVKSGIKPLVDGVPRGMVHSSDPNASQEARKMRLHGYGNAIVPQVAAAFIGAFTDVTQNL